MIDFAVIGSGISGATISNKLKKKYDQITNKKNNTLNARNSIMQPPFHYLTRFARF